ncbi:MAG: ComF family protein, partial [Actinomycetes bacterium]
MSRSPGGERRVRGARLLTALVDLVLPEECAGCGAAGRVLCPACAVMLAGPARLRTTAGPAAGRLPPVYVVADYGGPVRAALLAYKDRGRRGLANSLGAALARAVTAGVPEGPVLLVPVPSAR